MVFVVALQVISEAVDALCKKCNLYFWRTGVSCVSPVLGDGFAFWSNCHRYAFRVPAELRDQLVAIGLLTPCISPAQKALVDPFNLSGWSCGWAG